MKKILLLAIPLSLVACTAAPRYEAPLQVQAPGAPAVSSVGQGSIVGEAHQNYARKPNEINNAFWGGVIGAGVGQAIGHDTESTIYGLSAGALGGYYGTRLFR